MPLRHIPFTFAYKALIGILIFTFLYHISALLGFVPITMVWGGQLQTRDQLIQFESVALAINFLFLSLILIKKKRVDKKASHPLITLFLWLFVALFTLNTVGNLLALNSLETIIFTPLTFLLALFTARLALEK
ncbi:hypothetical protein [Arundinibacter roseus]|uniref:Uncharacterized protein n=1 Tax=Arundinibacter roseus TaxID=2070510 RepID=A0A4R4KIV2_9BACT|nr:hypothetical protein [Arundinibacter roseus]TDB68118.1 hypothetical protein EZE20_04125 [Arundinibacter roseus]